MVLSDRARETNGLSFEREAQASHARSRSSACGLAEVVEGSQLLFQQEGAIQPGRRTWSTALPASATT